MVDKKLLFSLIVLFSLFVIASLFVYMKPEITGFAVFEPQTIFPKDNATLSENNIEFKINISNETEYGIQNVTIEVFNSTGLVFSEINTSRFSGTYLWTLSNLSDGSYTWNVLVFENNLSNETGIKNFLINTT